MPILMFCVAFGLSMDYEVFLLSRIKEEHDRTHDNVRSVALGLERTGRIVTAAAVLISVVFLAFATSGVAFIKLFGIGLALAVLIDAFVIRATLVPAFMRLAGEVNWWAPAPMRRFYERLRDLRDRAPEHRGRRHRPAGNRPSRYGIPVTSGPAYWRTGVGSAIQRAWRGEGELLPGGEPGGGGIALATAPYW